MSDLTICPSKNHFSIRILDFLLRSDKTPGSVSLSFSFSSDSGDLDPELSRIASLGFTGCLSAVLFNSVSPLKAALLHQDTSPVIVTGPLVQSICGSTSANPYAAETTHHLSGQRKHLMFFLSWYCNRLRLHLTFALVSVMQMGFKTPLQSFSHIFAYFIVVFGYMQIRVSLEGGGDERPEAVWLATATPNKDLRASAVW